MRKNTKYPMPPYINYDTDWKFSFTMNSDDFDCQEWTDEVKQYIDKDVRCKIDYYKYNRVTCTIEYKKQTLVDNLKKWFWRK